MIKGHVQDRKRKNEAFELGSSPSMMDCKFSQTNDQFKLTCNPHLLIQLHPLIINTRSDKSGGGGLDSVLTDSREGTFTLSASGVVHTTSFRLLKPEVDLYVDMKECWLTAKELSIARPLPVLYFVFHERHLGHVGLLACTFRLAILCLPVEH